MGKEVLDTITGIVTAIVGLAIFSVILSKNANTTSVITAAGTALSTDISAATAPVTGGGGMMNNYAMGGSYDSLGAYN